MNTLLSPPTEECVSIPENAVHAVSVSLPLWKHNVAYEEGDPELSRKMKSGYPRFKIHYKIEELAQKLEKDYGRDGEKVMLFSTNAAARRCREFIKVREPKLNIRVLQLSCPRPSEDALDVKLSVVVFPSEVFGIAKQYWQHTGEGVSSRHAQYFYERLEDQAQSSSFVAEAPARSDESTPALATQPQEIFVEERFGRYLSVTLANEAKPALKTRIAHEISRRNKIQSKPGDVYLYSAGMTAIFSAYRVVMELFDVDKTQLLSVCFGFPYTDTLKILQKWGPGVKFFPFGDDEGDLVKLETQLRSGELKISSVFCEVPSNPLLNTPNLIRLHELALEFGFVLVVDDTVGNMANIDTISYADICVSSLTKLFSGDCNVMAGDLVLNPQSPFYEKLKKVLDSQFVDGFWAEDAIYLERNSRDFYDRNQRINANAESLVDLLIDHQKRHNLIKDVNYPIVSKSRKNYDALKYPDGGYGGLLSVVFHNPKAAVAFYDALFIAKGPSLGTNFTLACPYTVIAHYNELPFVNGCGVDTYLVRISIGLEEKHDLTQRFEKALQSAALAIKE